MLSGVPSTPPSNLTRCAVSAAPAPAPAPAPGTLTLAQGPGCALFAFCAPTFFTIPVPPPKRSQENVHPRAHSGALRTRRTRTCTDHQVFTPAWAFPQKDWQAGPDLRLICVATPQRSPPGFWPLARPGLEAQRLGALQHLGAAYPRAGR